MNMVCGTETCLCVALFKLPSYLLQVIRLLLKWSEKMGELPLSSVIFLFVQWSGGHSVNYKGVISETRCYFG